MLSKWPRKLMLMTGEGTRLGSHPNCAAYKLGDPKLVTQTSSVKVSSFQRACLTGLL